MWDADIAAQFRDAGKTPAQINAAADALVAAEEETWDAIDASLADADPDGWQPCSRESKYTDDPIYSVCNNDTAIRELIDACE